MTALGEKPMVAFIYTGGENQDAPDVAMVFGTECKKGEAVNVQLPRHIEILDANPAFERPDGRTKAARAAKAKAEEAK